MDAGFGGGALQCVTGGGEGVGELLVQDRRVRVITFTGSTNVGKRISQNAGVKKKTGS